MGNGSLYKKHISGTNCRVVIDPKQNYASAVCEKLGKMDKVDSNINSKPLENWKYDLGRYEDYFKDPDFRIFAHDCLQISAGHRGNERHLVNCKTFFVQSGVEQETETSDAAQIWTNPKEW